MKLTKLVALTLSLVFLLAGIACAAPAEEASASAAAAPASAAATEVPAEAPAAAPVVTQAPEEDSAKAKKDYQILYITPQASNPYFLTINAGAQDKATELGVSVKYLAPSSNDMQGQTTIVQGALVSNPDFVIIAPVDSEGMCAVCQDFADLNIPMITVDRDFNDKTLRLCAISSDNRKGGLLAAETANEMLGGNGEVAYLGFTPGVSSVDERHAGWNEGLVSYSGLKQVSEQYETSDLQKLTAKANGILTSNPDVKAIFAGFTNAGIAAATAMKENNLTDSVDVIAMDASPDEVELLKEGAIDALICQKAYDMGAIAVEYAVDYLDNGVAPPDAVHTEFVAITAANVNDPEIAKYAYRAAN